MAGTLGIVTLETAVDFKGLDKGLAQSEQKSKASFSGSSTAGSAAFTAIAAAGVAAMAAATAAVVNFAKESIAEFQQFEQGISEVFTLLPDMTQDAMSQMEADVLAFGAEVGRTSDTVIPALYQSISAGVPAENVFDFMTVASDAARGGVTDLETAVDALSTAVNAYGVENLSAQEASDLLFTAVKGGKTTFDELGASLFNVIPTAASLGLEFGNITAAMATMTSQGTPTAVATTQLRQLLIELSKEGSAAAETFERMAGKSFVDFLASGGNLQQALQLMEQAAGNAGLRLSDMFGSVEAGAAALTLTGAGTAKFATELAAATTATGATEEAAGIMAETLAFTEEKVAAATESLKIQIGEALEPSTRAWLELKLAIVEAATAQLEWGRVEDFAIEQLAQYAGQLTDAAQVGETFTEGNRAMAVMMMAVSRETVALNSSVLENERQVRRAQIAYELLSSGFVGTTAELQTLINRFEGLTPDVQARLLEEFTSTLGTANAAIVTMGEELTEADIRMLKFQNSAVDATAAALGLAEVNPELADKLVQTNNQLSDQAVWLNRVGDEAYEAVLATAEYDAALAAFNTTLSRNFVAALNSAEGVGFYNQTLTQLNSGTAEATLNQDSLNQAIFDAAQTAGADAAQLAILGGALGLYSEEAVEAALKTALIQAKIDELAASYVAGGLTVGGMQTALSDFIAGLDAVGPAAEGAAGSVGAATAALSEQDAALAEKLGVFDEQATTASGSATEAFETIAGSAEENMGAAASIVDTKAGEILTAVQTAFGEMAGSAETSNIAMVGSFETGMGEVVAAAGAGMETAVTTVEGYVVQFGAVGSNITSTMTAELLAGGGALAAAAERIVLDALAAAEAAAEAQSPSQRAIRLMRDVGSGMVIGLEDSRAWVISAIQDTMDAVFGVVSDSLSQAGSLGSAAAFFADMLASPIEAALAAIDEQTADLTDRIIDQMGGVLPDLTGDLSAMIASAEAAGNVDLAASLREYQELQKERQASEEEFATVQARILAIQEKQQQLAFLQQQLSLIRTLQEAGLDPSAVLEGINLGLDASVDDLLNASEAAMAALIEQADGQLGQAQDVAVSAFEAMTDGSEAALQAFLEMVRAIFGELVEISGEAAGTVAGHGAHIAQTLGMAAAAAAGHAMGGGVDRFGNPIPEGMTLTEAMFGEIGEAGIGNMLTQDQWEQMFGAAQGGTAGGFGPSTMGFGETMTADGFALAPGLATAGGGGDVTNHFYIDARGSSPGVGEEIQDALEDWSQNQGQAVSLRTRNL